MYPCRMPWALSTAQDERADKEPQSGYPNQFHIYGPQGPTLLSNGPTSVEVQGRWIADVIKKCETEGIKYINPTDEASKEWKKRINYLSELTLMPTTKST